MLVTQLVAANDPAASAGSCSAAATAASYLARQILEAVGVEPVSCNSRR
jgi:hypothetical protein